MATELQLIQRIFSAWEFEIVEAEILARAHVESFTVDKPLQSNLPLRKGAQMIRTYDENTRRVPKHHWVCWGLECRLLEHQKWNLITKSKCDHLSMQISCLWLHVLVKTLLTHADFVDVAQRSQKSPDDIVEQSTDIVPLMSPCKR